MDIDSIPLMSLLRGRLGYVNQRQSLLAENIANADTPGYVGRDLKPFTVEGHAANTQGAGAVHLAAQSAGHIAPSRTSSSNWDPVRSPDSEVTLNGNAVVLEEQMIKMTEARMEFDAAIGFYQKSLNMLRTAARRPGG